jgi:hypothetical protein
MTHRRLVGLTLLSVLLFSLAAEADDSVARKTLRRRLDHVVLEGKDLRPLLGASITKLRLFALKQGLMVVIPFQIDERTPSGSYAFDKGAGTKKDVDNGAFDANDELVFMARDSGAQAGAKILQPYKKSVEISLTDPKDKRKAWVYLVAFTEKDPPALSKKDYVSIKYDKNGLLTYFGHNFITGNDRSLGNAARTTSVRFKRSNKTLTPNIVDCTKTRVTLYYFAISVERNGTEMRVVIGAYIDGPVRVVALNVVEVYLLWGFWVRAPNSLIKFYDYGSEMPTNINIPINVDKADPASVARLSIDLSPRAQKWYFYNSWNKTPLPIDGVMSAKEKALDKRLPDWNVCYGPEGGIINRFSFENKAIPKAKYSQLFYRDDLRTKDGPEHEQGSYGNAGFDIDLSGLKTGVYKGCYYTYYKSGFRYGDERRYLDIVDKPIKVTVKVP